MINEREFSKISKVVGKDKIYFNPYYYKNSKDLLSISPLLAKKTIIYLTKTNFSKEEINKIADFKNEGYVVPVSLTENSLPKHIVDDKCILREKLFDMSLFDKQYRKSIEFDQQDEQLLKLLPKDSKKLDYQKVDSFSFSSNWDLMFMRTFNAPLFTSTEYRKALFHKLEDDSNIYFSRTVQHPIEIYEFMKQINVAFPSNLSVDQIKEFRKDKAAVQFKNWLEKKLTNYEDEQGQTQILHLTQEFNKLSNSYGKKIEIISTSLGGVAGAIIGAKIEPTVGGIGGGIAGAGVSYGLSKLWRKHGPNRWIFLLADFKKKGTY